MASKKEAAGNSEAAPKKEAPPKKQNVKEKKSSGGGVGIIILAIVLILVIAGAVYLYLEYDKQKKTISTLNSEVTMLQTQVQTAEDGLAMLMLGEGLESLEQESRESAAGIDASAAETKTKTAEVKAPANAGTVKEKAPSKSTKSTTTTAKKPSKKKTSRTTVRTVSRKAPPRTMSYAIFIDSFGTKRHADITKALFVMRHPAFIQKEGRRYNVYVGRFKSSREAYDRLDVLRSEYGPSCRVVQVYS